jgi:hypothetical protein
MAQNGDGGRGGRGRGGDGNRGSGGRSGRPPGSGRDDGQRAGSDRAPKGEASRASKSYRAQLDRLFSSGKIGELVASADKARAFLNGSGAPTGAPPQVTVSTGVVTRNQPGGDTAKAERERESRAGLGAELARAIARAESGGTPLVAAEPEPGAPVRRAAAARPVAATPGAPPTDAETRLKLIAKLRDAEGRDAITRACEALAARFPIPDDFELLTRLLEHRDPVRIGYALERLCVMLRKEQPRRGRALAAQLRFLEETSDEPELRTQAAEVRALVR